MIVSQSNKLNHIPSLNFGSMRSKTFNYAAAFGTDQSATTQQYQGPPSRRMATMYKDFCARYLTLSSLTIRLSSAAELVSLSEALKQRHSIIHLNLSHNKSVKDLEAWIAFGSALKFPTQTIAQLDISHNYLGSEGLSPIISDVIRSNRSITWINLSHNALDLDENHSILEALPHNQTITHLDLSSNEYQATLDVSSRIAVALSCARGLQHINLSRNSTRSPLSGLSAALADATNLVSIDLSHMTIADIDAVPLLKILVDSKSITSINLSSCSLSTCNTPLGSELTRALATRCGEIDATSAQAPLSQDDELVQLISHFSGASTLETTPLAMANPPLVSLQLGGINFGRHNFAYFLDLLSRHAELTSLDLSNTSLCEANGKQIADFIYGNPTLSSLNVSNNEFYETAVDIAEALANNASLTTLNISNTRSSNLIGKVLSRSLCKNRSLRSLDVSHLKLGHPGVLELAAGLASNEIGLESLNLCDTDLGDRGAVILGEALNTNKLLVTLYLNSNSIEKDGAKSLARGIKRNKTLRVLHLAYNSIGVKGVSALAKALRVNKSLADLSIKNNSISEKVGPILADSLRLNTTLETLNLRGNTLGNKGGASLAKLLSTNHSLTNIDVSNNGMDKDVSAKVYQSLRKNQFITSIAISQGEQNQDPLSSSTGYLESPRACDWPNSPFCQSASSLHAEFGAEMATNIRQLSPMSPPLPSSASGSFEPSSSLSSTSSNSSSSSSCSFSSLSTTFSSSTGSSSGSSNTGTSSQNEVPGSTPRYPRKGMHVITTSSHQPVPLRRETGGILRPNVRDLFTVSSPIPIPGSTSGSSAPSPSSCKVPPNLFSNSHHKESFGGGGGSCSGGSSSNYERGSTTD
eukprot:gene1414-1637_t